MLDQPNRTTSRQSQSEISVESPWDLSKYDRGPWSPGRTPVVRVLWYLVSLLCFENGVFPCSALKVMLLRWFGATLGRGVVIKPNVRIKFPWRLELGDHCWIGQEVWIDNLAVVTVGSHSCLSQGVYVCTGTHEFRRPDFRLRVEPVTVGESVWICCRATLLPGANVPSQSVVVAGSVIGRRASDEPDTLGGE